MAFKAGAGRAPFEPILQSRKPDAILQELTARLEGRRRTALTQDRKSLEADRDLLAGALKDIAAHARPQQVQRVAALVGMLDERLKQADEARRAIKDPPVVPANGWLLLGRVREADGSPPKEAKVAFEGGNDVTKKLLQPVPVNAQGEVRVALSAKDVAEANRGGAAIVTAIAIASDGRKVADVVPAPIVPRGLHQFDLTLPIAKSQGPAKSPHIRKTPKSRGTQTRARSK